MKKWLEALEDAIAAWWKTSYLRFPFSYRRYAKQVMRDEGTLNSSLCRKRTLRLMLDVRKERLAARRRRKAGKPAPLPQLQAAMPEETPDFTLKELDNEAVQS